MSTRNRSSRLFGDDRKERKRIPGLTPKYQDDDESSEVQISNAQVESPREFQLSEEFNQASEIDCIETPSKPEVVVRRVPQEKVQTVKTTEKSNQPKPIGMRSVTQRNFQEPTHSPVDPDLAEPVTDEVEFDEVAPAKRPGDKKTISQVHKKVINYFLTGESLNPDLEKLREARRKELEKARAEKEWAKPKKKYIPPPPTAGTGNPKSTFDESSIKSPRQKKNSKSSKESGNTPSQEQTKPKQNNKVFQFQETHAAKSKPESEAPKATKTKLSKVEEERSVERSKSKTSFDREQTEPKKTMPVSDPYLNDLVLPPPPARIPQVNIEIAPGIFNLQLILDTMNDIRTNPRAYVSRINSLYLDYITDKSYHKYFNVKYKEGKKAFLEAKVFLSRVKPVPALKLDDGLTTAAYLHSKYLSETNLLEHRSKDGTKPFERMLKYGSIGKAFKGGSENILRTPLPTPEDWLLDMVIDDGVATRGHRENFFNEGGAVGIGVARKGKDIWLTLDYFMHGFTSDPSATTKEVWKNSGLDYFHPKETKKEEAKSKRKRSEKSREKSSKKPEPLADRNSQKQTGGNTPNNQPSTPLLPPPVKSPKAPAETPQPPKALAATQQTAVPEPTPTAAPTIPAAVDGPTHTPSPDSVVVPAPVVPDTPSAPAPVDSAAGGDSLLPVAVEPPADEEPTRRRRSTEMLSDTPSQ